MKQIPRSLAVFAAALLLSPFATVSWAGPIVVEDASFEGFAEMPAAPKEAPDTYGPWVLSAGNAQVFEGHATWIPQTGNEFLLLPAYSSTMGSVHDKGFNNVLTQEVSGFVPGVEYRCTYYVSGYNNNSGLQYCIIEVSVLNEFGDLFDFYLNGSTTTIGTEANPWQKRTFTFTAPVTTGNLRIQVTRDDVARVYPAFDTFSIEPIKKGSPKVKLKKPKGKRSTTSRSRIAIKGKIAGPIPAEKVIVQVGRKKKMLTASRAFRYKAKLKPGRNKIKVRAIDVAGTLGKVTKHTVLRE